MHAGMTMSMSGFALVHRLAIIAVAVTTAVYAAQPRQPNDAAVAPIDLRAQYLEEPLAVQPTFAAEMSAGLVLSWKPSTCAEDACRVKLGAAESRGEQAAAWSTAFAAPKATEVSLLNGNGTKIWNSQVDVLSTSARVPWSILTPSSCYTWTVSFVYTEASSTTNSSNFCTGLFSEQDWAPAIWISASKDVPGMQYRREFNVSDKQWDLLHTSGTSRAFLYITCLGVCEVDINGKRILADSVLSQVTQFNKLVLYDTIDISQWLVHGDNVIGVTVGTWWYALNSDYFYNPPFGLPFGTRTLRAVIRTVDSASASRNTLRSPSVAEAPVITATDTAWKTHPGQVVSDDMFIGEVQDARLATPGWALAGFDDSSWQPAVQTAHPPLGQAKARLMPLISTSKTYQPVSTSKVNATTFVWDLGINMAGKCNVTFAATAGQQGVAIRFVHGEQRDAVTGLVIQSPATPNRRTGAGRIDENTTYILAGHGSSESFVPKFVYYGFRYLQASVSTSDQSALVQNAQVECYFQHTDLPRGGDVSFEDTDVLPSPSAGSGRDNSYAKVLSAVRDAILQSSRSNYVGYPTDCPTREKRGWMGDMLAASGSLFHLYDMRASYAKWLRDISASIGQEIGPQGCVAEIAPSFFHGDSEQFSDPAWGSGFSMLLRDYVFMYNDTVVARELFNQSRAYADHLLAFSKPPPAGFNVSTPLLQGTYPGSRYGDWCAVPIEPGSGAGHVGTILNTFYLVNVLKSVVDVANVVGEEATAKTYNNKVDDLLGAFPKVFYNMSCQCFFDPLRPNKTAIGQQNGLISNQTQQGVGLYLQGGSASQLAAAAHALNTDVGFTHGFHISTGVIGTKYVLEGLSEYGHHDTAVELAAQDSQPSLGFMALTEGTLWENWDGGGTWNHIMFGSQLSWMVTTLGGIRRESPLFERTSKPGWHALSVGPRFTTKLGGVPAMLTTVQGDVSSVWRWVASLDNINSVEKQTSTVLSWNTTLPSFVGGQVVLRLDHLSASSTSDSVMPSQVTVSESDAPVWQGGKFIPGRVGVLGGAFDAATNSIVFSVTGGTFVWNVGVSADV